MVEAATLMLLLVNLATIHIRGVAALLGPLHGTAYLTVIATAFLVRGSGRARWQACIPGVGGLLSLRGIRNEERPGPDLHL